jgi:hypothetical protein
MFDLHALHLQCTFIRPFVQCSVDITSCSTSDGVWKLWVCPYIIGDILDGQFVISSCKVIAIISEGDTQLDMIDHQQILRLYAEVESS